MEIQCSRGRHLWWGQLTPVLTSSHYSFRMSLYSQDSKPGSQVWKRCCCLGLILFAKWLSPAGCEHAEAYIIIGEQCADKFCSLWWRSVFSATEDAGEKTHRLSFVGLCSCILFIRGSEEPSVWLWTLPVSKTYCKSGQGVHTCNPHTDCEI